MNALFSALGLGREERGRRFPAVLSVVVRVHVHVRARLHYHYMPCTTYKHVLPSNTFKRPQVLVIVILRLHIHKFIGV